MNERQKKDQEREKYWVDKAKEVLLNKKIVNVRYLLKEEMEMLGFYSRCVVIELEDGTLVYPTRDDEGNDAGSLFYENREIPYDDYVLPVLH